MMNGRSRTTPLFGSFGRLGRALAAAQRQDGQRPPSGQSFLALNYACGRFEVWGYHAVNVSIHILAAIVLFGILRRTFLLPTFQDRFRGAATPLALVIALIWALHPLQVEAVTYVVQRAESLMGLFYLLTLYCVIRGAERRD